jgi:hypothetical protein
MQDLSVLSKIIPAIMVVIFLVAIILPQAIRILREYKRERRAKIVNAEGEFQAAEKMVHGSGSL